MILTDITFSKYANKGSNTHVQYKIVWERQISIKILWNFLLVYSALMLNYLNPTGTMSYRSHFCVMQISSYVILLSQCV